MTSKLQPVRGTHDILPDDFEKFHAVVTRARELATLYGFREMATPIFEPTEVFSRSMGETSDVVAKEMFTFQTKGEESVTLRPEFTAGIVRAFLSNGMQQHLPLKLFSTGPLFRYERPQKGRQRQFHQVNFEWLGDASPEADVEIIMLAGHLLFSLCGQKNCKLLINTLGDKESRLRYRDVLVRYLMPYKDQLSEDSQRRLVSNPLRILDSKAPQDQTIIQCAPNITNSLNDDSRKHFEIVCRSLTQGRTPFLESGQVKVTPSLVRGLDYYTGTVFEFVAETGELGAQNTVLAGGRYDGLVELMGGKPTPAIGFAAGIERLLLLMQDQELNIRTDIPDIKILILPFEGQETAAIHGVTALLRSIFYNLLKQDHTKRECTVEVLWQGSYKKRMERADKSNATHVIIFSPEDGINAFMVKNMKARQQQKMSLDVLNPANPDIIKDLNEIFELKKLDPGLRRDNN